MFSSVQLRLSHLRKIRHIVINQPSMGINQYLMAIINSILLGRAKGSIGNVSFSTQKGRVIARQKPSIVANPRTQAQLDQRAKLSAVNVAWYMIGNVIKSGITQLVGLGSQFNTYVSKNADVFAGKDFTKESFKTLDLLKSYASIGAYPKIPFTKVAEDVNTIKVTFNKNIFGMYAKVGDILKVVVGKALSSEQSYSEVVVTQAMLDAVEPSAEFHDLDLQGPSHTIGALWLESADGKTSSTSQFEVIDEIV